VADPNLDRTEFFVEPLGLFSHANADGAARAEAAYAARGMKFPSFAKIRVPARTLDRILSEFAPPDAAIDFLCVDVGGSELDVLKGLDLARRTVRAMLVRARDAAMAKQTASYLEARSYAVACYAGSNMLFTRNVIDAAASHPLAPHAAEGAASAVRLVSPNQPCDNVLRQEPGQPLWQLLRPRVEQFTASNRAPRRYRFAHVVHTFACPAGSNGEATQRFTFDALERAKCAARQAADIDLISVHLAGDHEFPPAIFRKARELDRTVLDVHPFEVPRRLPLVFDILERGIEAAEQASADFLVFTNADICPMPHFYEFVSRLLDLGFDSLLINRRVAGSFPLDGRWRALAESDYGGLHPGFDCFVFPIEFGRHLVRSDACVGAEYVMRGLLYNLVALSKDMLILTDVHATYHIGADSDAQRPELQDYTRFNQENAKAVLAALAQNPDAYLRLHDFCLNHHEFAVPDPPAAAMNHSQHQGRA
jgi:Methyltransferase FkbM domain